MKQPDLGLKILELRQYQGLTQDELVKKCNLSIRTLQRIESGEVEPRVYTLRLISKVLDFDYNSKESKPLGLNNMSSLDKTRNILIKRYASINNSKVAKINHKLKTYAIEEIIEKHDRMLNLSIALVTLLSVSLIIQFIILFSTKNITTSLTTNVFLSVLVLVFFQKGLHDNYEIKNILKTLKEIG